MKEAGAGEGVGAAAEKMEKVVATAKTGEAGTSKTFSSFTEDERK